LLEGAVAVEKNHTAPSKPSERMGNPNKPITVPQIELVKKIIDRGSFSLPEILDGYNVSELSKLSDADVQSIVKESKRRR
jgi:hypothetical protein